MQRQLSLRDEGREVFAHARDAVGIRLEGMHVVEAPGAVERDGEAFADMGADIDEDVHDGARDTLTSPRR
jgi:hypothetical protein